MILMSRGIEKNKHVDENIVSSLKLRLNTKSARKSVQGKDFIKGNFEQYLTAYEDDGEEFSFTFSEPPKSLINFVSSHLEEKDLDIFFEISYGDGDTEVCEGEVLYMILEVRAAKDCERNENSIKISLVGRPA